MSTQDILETLSGQLDEAQSGLSTLDSYYNGRQPAAFMQAKSRAALDGRLNALSVNFPRLLVSSVAERLRVTGFRPFGADAADESVWEAWQRSDLDTQAQLAHVDALTYGRSYVIVWVDAAGNPLVTVESAKQMITDHDPATGAVRAAVKRWEDGKEHYAVVYEPDKITRYKGKQNAMTVIDVIDNPLGEVPVVPIVNRSRLLDVYGSSEMNDILDLTDALNKVMVDAMVTSEYFARPRRWVTGLEIVEDEDGNPVNPFASEQDRVWQSENPETKFGQFDPARLDGYGDLSAVITQQIGAISGLPPHYLGLNGDQPPSADAIRSAEASLVSKAQAKQRVYGRAWARVADLIVKVRDGRNSVDFETVWASPETRTPGQVADAAVKLSTIGVPLESLLANPLGYTPAEIATIRSQKRAEALDMAGVDLSKFIVEDTAQ
ncbi:phage portal protein [Leucobacter tenebrionis]|uniref:phage portal protein n=1 Tax=Leucobacter tenebrionis TaxID=2873270 RepID=UPI001CA669DA|nr:phage portal protein [Leucobacter tenebrionis]QZY52718.1 phage portal protein [Leucobacter tenebrionis]